MFLRTRTIIRRALFGVLLAAVLVISTVVYRTKAALPEMKVTYYPECHCCAKWVEQMRQAGFTVSEVFHSGLGAIKEKYGITPEILSCHTAEIGGYAIEGHVPAEVIKRLLAEKPKATGLAVSGMPLGSPGMEGENPVRYDVLLFGPGSREVFASYRGGKPL